jgi:lipopolysaccharide/colanic/teichoic acid biosynthesis glycosyltransferase
LLAAGIVENAEHYRSVEDLALDHAGTMPILSLGVPRLSATARATKRALDIFASATSLVLGAPLLALIAVAIKLDSPGHVLFRQPRAGRGAGTFELLKFRSMRDGADACKPGLLHVNEVPGGVMFKLRRDPRITPVGRLLRRFWHLRRSELRPGLTGPWQVTGRSDVPFDAMIRFDYQYLAGWSLARDLEILCATVPAVLSGRGAY